MFQSVIGQSEGKGRFGSGVWVSLVVHAGILGAALLVSGGAQKGPPPEEPALVFVPRRAPAPAPAAPQVTSAPRPAAPKPAIARPAKPRPPLREPRMMPPPLEPLSEPRPTPPDESPAEPVGDEPPGAVDTSGELVPSGPVCADCVVGPALTARAEAREEVVDFGAGMTPPRLLKEAVPLTYTPEASRARVQGLLIARCTITRQGEVQGCRVIKGLPFMEEAVLESLAGRRYQPVTFQGRAVNALYTFNVHLRMP